MNSFVGPKCSGPDTESDIIIINFVSIVCSENPFTVGDLKVAWRTEHDFNDVKAAVLEFNEGRWEEGRIQRDSLIAKSELRRLVCAFCLLLGDRGYGGFFLEKGFWANF